jgi:hypothetical protein
MMDPQGSSSGFSDTLNDLVAKFNPSFTVRWIANISLQTNSIFHTAWHLIVENRSKDLENIYEIIIPRDRNNHEFRKYFQ